MTDQRDPTQDEKAMTRQDDPLRGSRTSRVWMAVASLVIVLLLLIIFIAQNTQNTQSVEVSFLGWDGTTSLSVALLQSGHKGPAR